MHITIMALGTRGDVQPYIALGQGLRQAGYTVKIAAPEDFESLSLACGLQFHAIVQDSRKMMAGEHGQSLIQTGHNGLKYLSIIARMAKQNAQRTFEQALIASRGTDAVIFNMYALMGYHIGEKLKAPTFATCIYPVTPTGCYPPIGMPGRLRLGPVFNRAGYKMYEYLVRWLFDDMFAAWRRSLELPPMRAGGIFNNMLQRQIPVLHAYSPSVMPAATDWPSHFHVTGYWFLDRPESWLPPDDLLAFLADGSPPVYVGFGSIIANNSEASLLNMVIDALRQAGRRGIIATRQRRDGYFANAGDDIYILKQAPHDWLFQHVSAVVHHGGAGTTAAGLRVGIPGVIIPFMGDQPFWGSRVETLGVGPKAIPFKRLTTARLAEAIHKATSNAGMKERARKLGQEIRSQDGVTEAVRIFEQYC